MLITGASTGIGRYLADYFAQEGNVVYAGARKSEDIDALSQIPYVCGVTLDVTRPADWEAVTTKIAHDWGYLDVLINNAGIVGWGAVMDRDLDYYRQVLEVNLFGPIQGFRSTFPLLKKSKQMAAVVNMSSQGGSYTFPFWTPYSMSKYALESFSDGLRRELRPLGIRVIVVKPGAIASEAFEKERAAVQRYRAEHSSEFSTVAARFFELALNRPTSKEKSPLIVARQINRALSVKFAAPFLHPGRRIIPDLMATRLPTRVVDGICGLILHKIEKSPS